MSLAPSNHVSDTAPASWAELLEDDDQQAFQSARVEGTLQAVRYRRTWASDH